MNPGMRITTNAMIRRYSTNLNKALGDLDSRRNTVSTNRNFNKIAEDPAAAMKSFKLRSNYQRTDVQLENTSDSLSKMNEVTGNVLNCSKMARQFIEYDLQGKSDPKSVLETRQTFQKTVDKLIDSFLQQMNGRYNENFIFGGASTKELPFTKTEDNIICYRGVPVNTPTSLTKDDISKILADEFGLKDAAAATNPDLSAAATAIETATTTGANAGSYTELANAINAFNAAGDFSPAKAEELLNTFKAKTEVQETDVEGLLQGIGLTDPALTDALTDIMGANTNDISYSDLEKAITNTTLLNDTQKADLKTALEAETGVFNITEADAKDILEKDPFNLKDAVTATNPSLTDATEDIMGDADSIPYDQIEAAIDASSLTDSQKYQLKANQDVSYQLKYATYFGEHSYRDIGFGMKEKEGEIVSTSAFDTAVNGLDIFGYGIDEDGLPNNIVALAQELSNLLGIEDDAVYNSQEVEDKYNKIIDKMPQVLNDMIDNGLAALGTKSAFLDSTEDQLTETSQILNEQISKLDFCDPAEAITELMWAQYAYNATLKVGNTLLSNSFIDFMS